MEIRKSFRDFLGIKFFFFVRFLIIFKIRIIVFFEMFVFVFLGEERVSEFIRVMVIYWFIKIWVLIF